MDDGFEGQAESVSTRPRRYHQFVLYSCRNQIYGIPVAEAREICFFANIDETFKSGKVQGALQLRGQTIPVLCSAILLGCSVEEDLKPTEDTRILVMHSDALSFGLIVDKVHQILVVAEDEIMPIPRTASAPSSGRLFNAAVQQHHAAQRAGLDQFPDRQNKRHGPVAAQCRGEQCRG